MNCFTHALPHLDDPYFAVGCCIPDWLSAADRKCRAREKRAREFVDHADPIVSATARGVVRHHQDDDWFHRTPVFNELILSFGVELRELFGNERTMRPSFVGHILVEMFLDAYLTKQHPGKLEFFYEQVESVDNDAIQSAVNRFSTRPTDKLSSAIERFRSIRFLFDYATEEGTIYWVNKILQRVSLDKLDGVIFDWLPGARNRVYNSASKLLPDYPISV
jgi:hypothetical protein